MNRRIRKAKNFWCQMWLIRESLLRLFRYQRAIQTVELIAGVEIKPGQMVCVDNQGRAFPV